MSGRRRNARGIWFQPRKLRQVRPRDLALRFGFGALTSLLAGVITVVSNATAGGLFLAFPALLLAGLTLIEKTEGPKKARQDTHGSIIGAIGLTAFAAVAATLLEHIDGGVVLVFAFIAWITVAAVGYGISCLVAPPK